MKISLGIPGREELNLELDTDGAGYIHSAKVSAVGNWTFLKLVQELRKNLHGDIASVPRPIGNSTGSLLIREALLRARGLWSPPYVDEETCHCRSVATSIVDLAIVSGAHTPRQVSAETSASTACGTCRPNVEAMITYRLQS